jgi:hypothetical protein
VSRSRLVCSSTSSKHVRQNRRLEAYGLEGCGTSKHSSPFAMSWWHRLHGDFFLQVFFSGRPKDEPINDGVLPRGILDLLYLADEAVQDLR